MCLLFVSPNQHFSMKIFSRCHTIQTQQELIKVFYDREPTNSAPLALGLKDEENPVPTRVV